MTTTVVAEALEAQFGSDRVTQLSHPLIVSEDFGTYGSEWGVPSVFWYVGGTDADTYAQAEQAGRIAEDIPTNHSSKFAPVLHPTLEAGIEALVAAAAAYLDPDYRTAAR